MLLKQTISNEYDKIVLHESIDAVTNGRLQQWAKENIFFIILTQMFASFPIYYLNLHCPLPFSKI